MKLNLSKPILYLITPGATVENATPSSQPYQDILRQVRAAAAAGIDLIQIREKRLSAGALFELTSRVMQIVRGSATRVLVNDRADIAAGAEADGVHLTTQSLDAGVVRKTFGADFLIGVSTHSDLEARQARDAGADFVVFGPVFSTPSKARYGPALGLNSLSMVTRELTRFPVLAIGGVSRENVSSVAETGASGIAAITLFSDPVSFQSNIDMLRSWFEDKEERSR
jgi:thiamine-phosphate pyrophosphorylase